MQVNWMKEQGLLLNYWQNKFLNELLKGKTMSDADVRIAQRVVDTEIEQCKNEIMQYQIKLEELQRIREKTWIAAISTYSGGRLILNLTALTDDAKDVLKNALEDRCNWISLQHDGGPGIVNNSNAGLTHYEQTKIIFPV